MSNPGDFEKAFIVGGYSEFVDSLIPLTEAVNASSLVVEAEPVTLAYAWNNRERFNREAERRLVIAHSFGCIAVDRAGYFVALNGAEPTPLMGSLKGALGVNTNEDMGREPHVPEFGPAGAAKELAMHPGIAIATPFRVRKASTVARMVQGGTEQYPMGRMYLPREQDEFGFGHNGEVTLARQNGIVAELLPGFHNQPLAHPLATTQEIYSRINAAA